MVFGIGVNKQNSDFGHILYIEEFVLILLVLVLLMSFILEFLQFEVKIHKFHIFETTCMNG